MSGIYHKGKEWANVTTPNPGGTASTDLTKVGIDGTNYNIKDANAAPNTPTFSEASTRDNLSGSGETMATILGKIKKWFTDLKDLAFIEKDGASSTKYLRGDGTWQAFPTIPTVNDKTLTIQKNGTQVAQFTANSASDVTANITVPTKVSDLTNDSGFVTTDEKVTGQTQNPTSSTWYNMPFIGTSNQKPYYNNGLRYKTLEGTTSAKGESIFSIGNSTASGTAGNKTGIIRIYGDGSGYSNLKFGGSSSTRAHTLPDKAGTIALTEDFATASVNYATSAGSATDSTKLPLAGGTMTGTLTSQNIIPNGTSYDLGNVSNWFRRLYAKVVRLCDANGYLGILTTNDALTADRTYTFPDSSGTLATQEWVNKTYSTLTTQFKTGWSVESWGSINAYRVGSLIIMNFWGLKCSSTTSADAEVLTITSSGFSAAFGRSTSTPASANASDGVPPCYITSKSFYMGRVTANKTYCGQVIAVITS